MGAACSVYLGTSAVTGWDVRMLPGASARKLCVQWTLEVFLQEENVEWFLNLP